MYTVLYMLQQPITNHAINYIILFVKKEIIFETKECTYTMTMSNSKNLIIKWKHVSTEPQYIYIHNVTPSDYTIITSKSVQPIKDTKTYMMHVTTTL